MKVEKSAFDSTLGKLLRAEPLPLSAIPRKKATTKRKGKRATIR
jgi:hypothetical protein